MLNIRFSEAQQAAKEARAQMEAAQKKMQESIRLVLQEGFVPIFEKYPFLDSIAWAQYTPYFNDGSPCVFSSSLCDVSLNTKMDIEEGTAQYSGYENGEDFYKRLHDTVTDYSVGSYPYPELPNPDHDPQYEACQKEVLEFFKAFTDGERSNYEEPSSFDQALRGIFGDHVSVTITREGIEVESYDHE